MSDLGIKITRSDLKVRVFVHLPSLCEAFSCAEQLLTSEVASALSCSSYIPNDVEVCEVPKPGFAHRPGVILSLRDSAMYASVTASVLPAIDKVLQRTESIDFGCRRAKTRTDGKLFSEFFENWRAFAKRSVELAKDAQFVVTCDVAGYYENIDLHRLLGDLRAAGCELSRVDMLQKLLYHWSDKSARGRGLPQGHSASDLLAKFYLCPFDRALQAHGVSHLRYNDDIRLFCSSKRDAERRLNLVIRELRKRGLILQSAKTKIFSGTDAEEEFNRPIVAIQGMKRRLAKESAADLVVPSISESALAQVLESHPHIELRSLKEVFRSRFIVNEAPYDSSVLHYILNQLAKQKDGFALHAAIRLLGERPDESQHLLAYLASLVKKKLGFTAKVRNFLHVQFDDRCYQQYQVLRWYGEHFTAVSEDTLKACRRFISDRSFPRFVRDAAKEVVRKFGDEDDFEAVENHFDLDVSDESKAVSFYAVIRQEVSRRNSFYSRNQGRSPFLDAVIRDAKSKSSA